MPVFNALAVQIAILLRNSNVPMPIVPVFYMHGIAGTTAKGNRNTIFHHCFFQDIFAVMKSFFWGALLLLACSK